MSTREMARALGRRGGRARARRLSADERRRIASLGGQARNRSLQIARRVADNFRHARAVAGLRGHAADITRLNAFEGPLPGIYGDRRNHARRRIPS